MGRCGIRSCRFSQRFKQISKHELAILLVYKFDCFLTARPGLDVKFPSHKMQFKQKIIKPVFHLTTSFARRETKTKIWHRDWLKLTGEKIRPEQVGTVPTLAKWKTDFMENLIIYCLNCIRRDINSTSKPGLRCYQVTSKWNFVRSGMQSFL